MDSEKDPPDDAALFRAALKDIRPLKAVPRVVHELPRPAPVPRQRTRDERAVLLELLDAPDPRDELETGEELLFLRDGYQQRYLKRLRRGHYSVLDEIDLHHMNHDTARDVLLNFISDSVQRGCRCVRVVHGKGLRSKKRPVLKDMTRRMLQRHPSVIAFASCRPVDGGTGAVSVLLKS
jgi:DNA-nicking Smr family endonuclease